MRISFLSIFFGLVLSSWICENPITLWDKAKCSFITETKKYQEKCVPIRVIPKDVPIKGLIMLYTGYTGCPETFGALIKDLSSKGYAVLVPLLPGHGISIGWNCFIPKICVSNGFNPSYLPKTKQKYIDFVVWSAETAKEEASLITNRAPDFFVGALGLSLGGSLATLAMTLPNTPFTKVIAVNPFYSISIAPLDFAVLECLERSDKFACVKGMVAGLLRKKQHVSGDNGGRNNILLSFLKDFMQKIKLTDAIKMLQENASSDLLNKYDNFITSLWKSLTSVNEIGWIQKLGVLDTEYGWGPDCVESAKNQKVGMCAFRMRNLLAVHAFSEYAISKIGKMKTGSFAVIHSDRDGLASDSLNGAVVSQLSLQGVTSSKCRFKVKCDKEEFKTAKGNTCGAPHSLFSQGDNVASEPFVLYWEKSLYENISNFFGGEKIGDVSKGLDFSKCVATTNTINAGKMFDSIGTKYLQDAYKKFRS